MSDGCELCHHDVLEPVYTAEGSTRGLKIHLCNHCGLLQSLPRIDRAPRRAAAASGSADWGNIRYGKGFRTKQAVDALAAHADLNSEFSLLDVGSNRGSFVRALLETAPSATVTAVEPDERVSDACKDLTRTKLIAARIEDTALEDESFDIVHSCHTIEHLAHPAAVLADHWRVLKPGGLLVLDAPSTAILESEDMIEEWFIDKHLYHFSCRTLMRMVTAAGFDVIEPPDLTDTANLLIVARKSERGHTTLEADPREVEDAKRLIAAYGANRAANLAAITAVAAELTELAHKRVVLWGAGRLFDTLVIHGGLMPSMLEGVIDVHLKAHIPVRHGCELKAPEALAELNPSVIIVMSRGFADEISAHASRLVPNAEIITYGELMRRARLTRPA
jgi:ubiquinone/menaquinone biosynthesis C-methylase UbiE